MNNDLEKKMIRVRIFEGTKDISDEVEMKNGRALPGGWFQKEIHYKNKRIGWIESGDVDITEEGYSFTETEEDNQSSND